MTNRVIPLLILICLLGSCAPAPASPTLTPTATVLLTRTPQPTQTAILTTTLFPPLQTEGPYLLFTNDNKTFTITDADGSGRKQFQLPNDGEISHGVTNAISPDGKWLAYYTGSAEKKPYDLTLHLYNLEDQTSVPVASLIARGFPENLEPVTETIRFTEYDTGCSKDPACRLRIVQLDFRTGIRSFGWSPDSQQLAFAAQIDSPSSDVYIYNLEEKTKQVLTNERENIGLMISWTPNGEKILYTSSIPETIYYSQYLHIANTNIEVPQNPNIVDSGTFWGTGGWITENWFFLWDAFEGAAPTNLRFLNSETQQATIFWNYSADSFFIDTEKQRVVLLALPYGAIGLIPPQGAGIYVVTFDGNYTKISDEIYYPGDQGLSNSFFAIQIPEKINYAVDENYPLVSIGFDGTIMDLGHKIGSIPPSVSPDKKWAIVSSDKKTFLYSENLQLVKVWDIYSYETIWRPDSKGVFLSDYPNTYYVRMDDEELNVINICDAENCIIGHNYVWLP